MANKAKIEQVEKLVKLFQERKNFLLVKYKKIPHKLFESLRITLKKNNSRLKIVKNTLLGKTFNKLIKSDEKFLKIKKTFLPLKENTGLVVFSDDWSKSLKDIYQFAKKNTQLEFRLATLDDNIYGKEEVEKIAKLPGRLELVGKLISTLKAPLNNFVYNIKYHQQKLVYILNQKSQSSK